MQDNLKDHINKNRSDFEVYPFDPMIEWDQIVDHLPTKKPAEKSFSWKKLAIAACLVGLTFISSLLLFSAGESGEISEIEGFYASQINQKVSLIKNHETGDRILSDLEKMDEVFAELKSDLKENVDNEEVLMALMENYRLKLQILEDILNELEKENSEEVL